MKEYLIPFNLFHHNVFLSVVVSNVLFYVSVIFILVMYYYYYYCIYIVFYYKVYVSLEISSAVICSYFDVGYAELIYL